MFDFLAEIGEIVRSEWRAAKKRFLRLVVSICLAFISAVLFMVGLLTLLASLFLLLLPHLGGTWAALICGLTSLAAAAILICIGRWMTR